jgi:hypothetical protein
MRRTNKIKQVSGEEPVWVGMRIGLLGHGTNVTLTARRMVKLDAFCGPSDPSSGPSTSMSN